MFGRSDEGKAPNCQRYARGGRIPFPLNVGLACLPAKFDEWLRGSPANAPVVGMASAPDGKGYWLVASDGGVFTDGDATFYGSHGAYPLSAPVVGMASVGSMQLG